MPLVSPSTFASRLGELDQAAFAGFVAALWAARGFETAIDGRVVRASGPDGREEVLWVTASSGWLPRRRAEPPEEVDAVVTNRRRARRWDGESSRVVTADALREMLLYAIDRSVGDELCQRFLDCAITHPASERDAWPRRVMAELSGERAFVLAGGLAVLVIAAGVLAAPVAWDDRSPTAVTPAPAVNGTPVAFRTATPTPTPTPAPEIRRTPVPVEPGLLPPGIDRRGIDDAEALARAHAFSVSQRSYALTINYREFNNSMRAKRETILVENQTRYSSELITAGPLSTNPYVIADRELYADGHAEYARIPGETGVSYARQPVTSEGAGEFAERVQQYLQWFLTVEDSFIRDIETQNGTTYYQVITRGDPYDGVENARGIAIIESHGVVRYLQRVYTIPDSNDTSVTITIEYTDFENVSVEEPWWYGDAVNTTNATTPQPRTPTPNAIPASE